ncbi:MAG: hypothetical protein WC756_22205 [Taibaiella sp.]|jgi:hypothetical protein
MNIEEVEGVIDSLIEYIQEIKEGKHKESAEDLYIIVERVIECTFTERHLPINRLINSAIERKDKK